MNGNDDIVTVTTAEAARILGLTPRRVRALKSRIAHEDRAGRLFFDRASVMAFLELSRPAGRKRK